ncbi:hypothetical protein [Novosphingobium sp. TCA1]|uniref:DUF1214 domain-containing protein n=1 Tax=Novosphingobium pentaromativorans TaxID=205844 RepID=A0A2W5NLM2_9SPHN|nr:hypothetical protein [Novosphingobium sp. TCA1]PZQ53408.1 MAG: hypothetical protein DI555_16455 [Novosphingobium pentaromativorans]GFE75421.1 hypothetical protein NTCA1_30700 [Novosphingobium sp. TCA1]
MSTDLHLTPLLAPLEEAIAQLGDTWRPDDPAYRADVLRQTMTSLSYACFAYFHADAEHPDWAPLWNPVYTLQPNPDDIYLQSPIRGDLTYRVSGNRGTCRILSFTTQRALSGTVDEMPRPSGHNEVDDADLGLAPGEDFEVIFSARRPAGYTGRWAPIDPEARGMIVRYRSYDWLNEVDPVLSIECLDPVPPKPRLTPDDIVSRIGEMARFPARKTRLYYPMQNGVKERVGFNVFEPVRMPGALAKQVYWPACFQFDPDEALIIETELPPDRPYWNIQLNDPLFNALEYVYRLSSTNGHYARASADGKLRAVIALTDPGVPNWLDPAGYTEGGIYGRWYDCSSAPTPTITRVKLAALRDHLPADTPVVTPEQRAEELRQRVRACQRRRRW